MVKITFYQTADGVPVGFDAWDHAEYADHGKDIVCAAVSAMVINTVNSLEELTEDPVHLEQEEENGRISLRVQEKHSEKADVLLRSLALGLSNLEAAESYQDFIDLIFEEV